MFVAESVLFYGEENPRSILRSSIVHILFLKKRERLPIFQQTHRFLSINPGYRAAHFFQPAQPSLRPEPIQKTIPVPGNLRFTAMR
jgi:hypothetical protein